MLFANAAWVGTGNTLKRRKSPGSGSRGQTGDDRRCPECGEHTSPQLLWATWIIRRQSIRAFESPVIPGLLFIPVALFGWPFLIRTSSPAPTWIVASLCGFILIWVVGLGLYARKYARHHDYYWFLLEAHLVIVAIVLGGPAVLVSLGMLATGTLIFVSMPLLLVCLGMFAVGLWAYRDMRRRLPAYKLPKLPKSDPKL